ncbi:MAG TPA: malto-oligosyltrehalose synthase [Glaciibacter sp.]|nr:malto-oligosyltrehalose synthase [Glaciibacter sp.]
MMVPRSTYRLQITRDFDLDAAAGLVDYLGALGVDWIYLSPLLKAEEGSNHGYDVVDPTVIDPARGGPDALARLSQVAKRAGMGILADIVPNHMGVATPAHNAWWWDLLTYGREARHAEAFDVDWDFGGGRIRIPVLGDGDDELEHLELVGDELHYYDIRFPVTPGSAVAGDDPVAVHEKQHYELVNWRRADYDLNYRRFFAVNSLAGIRVEVPRVFEECHAEITRWVRDGQVQGLRVDHPDGLAHPGRYLDRLAQATEGAYILVEKILEGREQLPPTWQTAGTTGYDALADFDRILVDPAGQEPLDALESRLQGAPNQPVDWAELVYVGKRSIADGILRSEVLRLARLTPGIENAADAIAELIAWFPVYRSYLPVGLEHLHAAADLARKRRPDLAAAIDQLLPILSDPSELAAERFQQTSGMVMAKGVEDTAYYQYSRLTSLNEVGAEPAEFAISIDEFHGRQQLRLAASPHSMTTLSTHDTKRGEDVRARISVLAEIPGEWESALATLRAAKPIGDPALENLLWQAIIGASPASPERLHAYAEKAAREAGTSTTWTAPNDEFEEAMHDLISSSFDDETVSTTVQTVVERVRQAGWSNGLSAKLLQLTAPGVPDVYQGSELWEMSLVDPDNRRPVDYAERRTHLTAVEDGWLPSIDASGAAKLLVTTRALRLRRDAPERFFKYAPVAAFGAAADHVIAFDRGGAVTVATRLPLGLQAAGGWRDTILHLAGRPVVDILTGERFPGSGVPVADLLSRYPVALLIPEGEISGQ